MNYTMHLSALLQFSVSTDCSIREYRSIFMELNSISLKYPPIMLALCWHSTPAAYYTFYYAGILEACLA